MSKSWEGIRNAQSPVHIGDRPLTDYIFRPDEQLFDMDKDPGEVHNIARDPEFAGRPQRLAGAARALAARNTGSMAL